MIGPEQLNAVISAGNGLSATTSTGDDLSATLAEVTPIPGPPGPEGPQGPPGDPASQTPWAQHIDAAGYDLNNLGVIRSAPDLGTTGPDATIQNLAGTLHLLAESGGSIDIESVGTGRIMVSTDATRRIVVRQNGNVGIGPSMNPSYLLDVQGDCNVEGVYRINGVALATGVSSVFGRSGAVVAVSGDYSASQVTNAVSIAGSYADPSWITSLAWGKITGAPSTFPPSTHTHAAEDTTSGVFVTARLGTGTQDATTVLRGDGTWATALTKAQAQTPWTQNISGAGYSLSGAGQGNFAAAVANLNAYYGGIWIEEALRAGSSSGNMAYSPRLSFIWSGRDATQIGMDAAGVLRTFDGGGTAYAPFAAAQIESKSGGFKFPDATVQTTAALTKAAYQTPWTQNIDAAGYTLTNAGNVGIGTASPTSALEVKQSINPRANVTFLNLAGAGTGKMRLRLGPSNGFDLTDLYPYIEAYSVDVAQNAGLAFGTYYGGVVGERMRIDAYGNVGIGTASPPRTLTVRGNAYVYPLSNPASVSELSTLLLGEDSGNTAWGLKLGLAALSGVWTGVVQAIEGGTPTVLTLNPSGGNVGIGTASPGDRLTVIGSGDTQIRVSNSETYYYTVGRQASSGWLVFTGNQDGFNGYEFKTGGGARSSLRVYDNGEIAMSSLPTSNPGAGTKKLWCDTAAGNVVKWAI